MSNARKCDTYRVATNAIATPEQRAAAREHETLGQRLTNHSSARRTERESHRELSPARRHARELEAREIQRDDQHHRGDGEGEHDQRRTEADRSRARRATGHAGGSCCAAETPP